MASPIDGLINKYKQLDLQEPNITQIHVETRYYDAPKGAERITAIYFNCIHKRKEALPFGLALRDDNSFQLFPVFTKRLLQNMDSHIRTQISREALYGHDYSLYVSKENEDPCEGEYLSPKAWVGLLDGKISEKAKTGDIQVIKDLIKTFDSIIRSSELREILKQLGIAKKDLDETNPLGHLKAAAALKGIALPQSIIESFTPKKPQKEKSCGCFSILRKKKASKTPDGDEFSKPKAKEEDPPSQHELPSIPKSNNDFSNPKEEDEKDPQDVQRVPTSDVTFLEFDVVNNEQDQSQGEQPREKDGYSKIPV